MRLNRLHESRIFKISPEVESTLRSLSKAIVRGEFVSDIVDLGGLKTLVTYDPTHNGPGKNRWNPERDIREIIVGSTNAGRPERIYDTLVHEYAHMVDPGAGRYGPIGSGGEEYWAHPDEFNALSTEIIHKIVRKFREARNTSSAAEEMFLSKVYDLLKYPKYIADWGPFGSKILDWWEDKPELWRKFKTRLYNAIRDELEIHKTERDMAGSDFVMDYIDDGDFE